MVGPPRLVVSGYGYSTIPHLFLKEESWEIIFATGEPIRA